MCKELGKRYPFYNIYGSEIIFSKKEKCRVLHESVRKSIGVRFYEKQEYYEGQIVDIISEKNLKKNKTGISGIIVSLKTQDSGIRIKLYDSLCNNFITSGYKIGDVIKIDPKLSTIERLYDYNKKGRSELKSKSNPILFLPKGKVFKRRRFVREITINDLDMINSDKNSDDMIRRYNKSNFLENEVDLLLENFLSKKKAHLIRGLLVIDDAHFLNVEDIYFLNKIIESKFSPIVLLLTNREQKFNLNLLHNFSNVSAYTMYLGIRLNIIPKSEHVKIIADKSKEAKVYLSGKTFIKFLNISKSSSIRYGILLKNYIYLLAMIVYKDFGGQMIFEFCKYFFLDKKELSLIYGYGCSDFKLNLCL